MNKRYKTLMVGCGGMSGAWLECVRDHFADRVEIIGLVDLNRDNANRRAAEYGYEDAWTGASIEEALIQLSPEVVFNCTVPGAHLPTCRAALSAGCNVLVEKPMATSIVECAELARLAAKTGRLLAVIQNRRYLPGAKAVQRALAEGVIGAVHTICADFFMAPRFGGFRETMESPLILDMAIHTFDQCRFLTGFNPRSVACLEFNPRGSWFAQGASAIATFEMTDGAVFNYRGSWCAQGFPTSWAGSWRIVGQTGTLLWDGEANVSVEKITGEWDGKAFHQPVEKISIPPVALAPAELGHAGNIREFLDAIDSGGVPQTVASDNILSIAMVESAINSARHGAPVAIPNNLL